MSVQEYYPEIQILCLAVIPSRNIWKHMMVSSQTVYLDDLEMNRCVIINSLKCQ